MRENRVLCKSFKGCSFQGIRLPAECYSIEKGLAVQIRKFKIIAIENKAC